MMSKYVISSPEYAPSLMRALANNPKGKGSGRDAYLMSRSGKVVATRKIMLRDVGVAQKGTTAPLSIEGTKHQVVLITVDRRDDIVK